MDFLLEYKWIILISLEVLAWSSTFFMFYARYGMRSSFWFRVGVVLFAITGVIPQVIMGIINFIGTGEIDTFTLVILILIIYGFTFGKKDAKKIDRWMQMKFGGRQEKQG